MTGIPDVSKTGTDKIAADIATETKLRDCLKECNNQSIKTFFSLLNDSPEFLESAIYIATQIASKKTPPSDSLLDVLKILLSKVTKEPKTVSQKIIDDAQAVLDAYPKEKPEGKNLGTHTTAPPRGPAERLGSWVSKVLGGKNPEKGFKAFVGEAFSGLKGRAKTEQEATGKRAQAPRQTAIIGGRVLLGFTSPAYKSVVERVRSKESQLVPSEDTNLQNLTPPERFRAARIALDRYKQEYRVNKQTSGTSKQNFDTIIKTWSGSEKEALLVECNSFVTEQKKIAVVKKKSDSSTSTLEKKKEDFQELFITGFSIDPNKAAAKKIVDSITDQEKKTFSAWVSKLYANSTELFNKGTKRNPADEVKMLFEWLKTPRSFKDCLNGQAEAITQDELKTFSTEQKRTFFSQVLNVCKDDTKFSTFVNKLTYQDKYIFAELICEKRNDALLDRGGIPSLEELNKTPQIKTLNTFLNQLKLELKEKETLVTKYPSLQDILITPSDKAEKLNHLLDALKPDRPIPGESNILVKNAKGDLEVKKVKVKEKEKEKNKANDIALLLPKIKEVATEASFEEVSRLISRSNKYPDSKDNLLAAIFPLFLANIKKSTSEDTYWILEIAKPFSQENKTQIITELKTVLKRAIRNIDPSKTELVAELNEKLNQLKQDGEELKNSLFKKQCDFLDSEADKLSKQEEIPAKSLKDFVDSIQASSTNDTTKSLPEIKKTWFDKLQGTVNKKIKTTISKEDITIDQVKEGFEALKYLELIAESAEQKAAVNTMRENLFNAVRKQTESKINTKKPNPSTDDLANDLKLLIGLLNSDMTPEQKEILGNDGDLLLENALGQLKSPQEKLVFFSKVGIPIPDSDKDVKAIDLEFTVNTSILKQRIAHEAAKVFLTKELEKTNATVDFISPPATSVPELDTVTINPELLSADVFSFEYTSDVKIDITQDGKRQTDDIVIYGAASQFNGSESTTPTTLMPKESFGKYSGDKTQGPQSQIPFGEGQIKAMCGGANIGYNGLGKVLTEKTKGDVKHGYFVSSSEETATEIIGKLKTDGSRIEYPCVANVPAGGQKPVHLILVAAPCLSNKDNLGSTTEEQKKQESYLFALHGFRAQFSKSIQLAEQKKKPVTLKIPAVGLGAFKNDPEIIAKAFFQAASEYQDKLQQNKVTVRFQIFKDGEHPDSTASRMSNKLKLKQYVDKKGKQKTEQPANNPPKPPPKATTSASIGLGEDGPKDLGFPATSSPLTTPALSGTAPTTSVAPPILSNPEIERFMK